MDEVEEFIEHRPHVFGIAYRMLGSTADADDIVQEAYLRWAQRTDREVGSARSYLSTVVVRLCLDHLSSARVRRESYVGQWLPEPVVVIDPDNDVERAAESADSLSMAFLLLLEELGPAERAAFLLHEVFEYNYTEIAEMLGRSDVACRQLVSRGRRRIRTGRQRFDADRAAGQELARRFFAACVTGDIPALIDMLAPDVVMWTDGGGKVKSALHPTVGAAKSAMFLAAIAQGVPTTAHVTVALVNGQPGFMVVDGDVVITAVELGIVAGQVTGVRAVVNPDKLFRLKVVSPQGPALVPEPGTGWGESR